MSAKPTAGGFDVRQLTEPAARVEAYIESFLTARPLPGNLLDAVQYALLGGGKRLRPILVVRACEAVGGLVESALPAAAAIEMIHAFSLAHDDLPAMDNDDLRRGRPTLHRAFPEAMAILAGDALTSLAFEVILTKSPAAVAGRVATELAAATTDMIAGQVYDTLPQFDEATPALERLQTIHRNKTGALIRCSCRMGAIAGGADEATLQRVTRHAEAIGLMFQVVDDVLDVTQPTEQLGKTAGKDVAQNKLTYPALIGLDASRAEVQRLRIEAHEALAPLGERAQPLLDLCDYMAVRTK